MSTCEAVVVETVALQVQIAQDADLHSVTESLLHHHHHATIVTSLKTWLHVLRVSVIIISVVCASNFRKLSLQKFC